MPRPTAAEGWSWCPPGGFGDRIVRDAAGLRTLLDRDAVTALHLLVDEVGDNVGEAELQTWLVESGLLDPSAFRAWWARTRQQLPAAGEVRLQDRFVRVEQTRPDHPSARCTADRERTPSERQALLETAIGSGDGLRARQLLRTLPHPDPGTVQALTRLALAGDRLLLAALLTRSEAAAIPLVCEAARSHHTRAVIEQAVRGVPAAARHEVALALLNAALSHDDETAALWIGDVLVGSASADRETFPRAAQWLQARSGEQTLQHAQPPSHQRLQDLGAVAPVRLWKLGTRLARALAARHAGGECGGVASARVSPDGGLQLGPAHPGDPRADVRDAARLLCELAIGRVPDPAKLDDEAVLAHLPALAPLLTPAWIAVITRSLAPLPALRPGSGLELWEQLAQAEAIDGVRTHAPRRPGAPVTFGADTHVGRLKSRSRQTNQDAWWAATHGGLTMLVVADGISVSNAGSGDLASQILVRTFSGMWESHAPRLVAAPDASLETFVREAFAAANDAICAATLRIVGGPLTHQIPMGTTAVVALVRGGQAIVGSLGDSRAWVVGAAGAASVTGDQNVRGLWLESWRHGEPIAYDGEGHALVGYVGRFDEGGTPAPLPPALRRVVILPGECLVLSTDGLNDYAAGSGAELAVLLEQACTVDDLDAAARFLVEQANAGGGGDNVTVIVARQHSS